MFEQNNVLLVAIIAGATEGINRARAKDWWVVVTILTAAGIGGLFGAMQYAGVPDVATGIAAGLGASGVITVLGAFGNKSTPSKSDAVTKE